jgi:hypothetical protein
MPTLNWIGKDAVIRHHKELYQLRATSEKHPPAGVDQRTAQGANQVAFAHAGRAEQQHIGATVKPRGAFGQGH